MGKTQVLSALGLAFILGALNTNYSYATEVVSATTVERDTAALVVTSESAQNVEKAKGLSTAVNDVEKVLKETENVTNTEYPGLREYLQGLVDESKKPENQGSQELAEVLDEASAAAALLTGTYRTSVVMERHSAAARTMGTGDITTYAVKVQDANAEEEPVAEKEVTPATLTTNTTVKVTVASTEEAGAEADDEMKLDETTNTQNLEQVAEQSSDEAIEVPKTGEAKMNFGILIVAGIGVVIATLGATAVILRSRKNA